MRWKDRLFLTISYWLRGGKYNVRRAQRLCICYGMYYVCLERTNVVDVFLFYDLHYVGRASLKILDKSNARLYNLYVNPNFRRCGFARELVKKIIYLAKGKTLDLLVRKNNLKAVELYNGMHFKCEEKKNRYGFYMEL